MTDLYIATSTQADHDALMRLAESAGYKWHDDDLPTVCNLCDYGEEEENVVHLYDDFQEGRRMAQDDRAYYESQDVTIETIPNLADIKAIWKVQPDDHKAFFKGKSYKHPLPSDESVIMLEMTDELAEGLMDIYKALAVEYKPQESKAMNKKVKLPRNVIDTFRPALDNPHYRRLGSLTPIRIISDMYNRTLEGVANDVAAWLNDYDSQWLLIDALRYGYEAEPEQLYYVWFVKGDYESFLNVSKVGDKVDIMTFDNDDDHSVNGYRTKFTMEEIEAIDSRYRAFAVKVEQLDNAYRGGYGSTD